MNALYFDVKHSSRFENSKKQDFIAHPFEHTGLSRDEIHALTYHLRDSAGHKDSVKRQLTGQLLLKMSEELDQEKFDRWVYNNRFLFLPPEMNRA